MHRDLAKTLTYLAIHLAIGFSVAYALTGSVSVAGGIALLEPCLNAIAFFFHEKAWKRRALLGRFPSPIAFVVASVLRKTGSRFPARCSRLAA